MFLSNQMLWRLKGKIQKHRKPKVKKRLVSSLWGWTLCSGNPTPSCQHQEERMYRLISFQFKSLAVLDISVGCCRNWIHHFAVSQIMAPSKGAPQKQAHFHRCIQFFPPTCLQATINEGLNVISYSQSQTEDGGSIVKVVDHFIVGCAVHLYMPERQNRGSKLHQVHIKNY